MDQEMVQSLTGSVVQGAQANTDSTDCSRWAFSSGHRLRSRQAGPMSRSRCRLRRRLVHQPRNRSKRPGPMRYGQLPPLHQATSSRRPLYEAALTPRPHLEGEATKLIHPHRAQGSTGSDRLDGRRQRVRSDRRRWQSAKGHRRQGALYCLRELRRRGKARPVRRGSRYGEGPPGH